MFPSFLHVFNAKKHGESSSRAPSELCERERVENYVSREYKRWNMWRRCGGMWMRKGKKAWKPRPRRIFSLLASFFRRSRDSFTQLRAAFGCVFRSYNPSRRKILCSRAFQYDFYEQHRNTTQLSSLLLLRSLLFFFCCSNSIKCNDVHWCLNSFHNQIHLTLSFIASTNIDLKILVRFFVSLLLLGINLLKMFWCMNWRSLLIDDESLDCNKFNGGLSWN